MKSRIKLHIGAVEVKVGLMERVWNYVKEHTSTPISAIKFDGLDIEFETEIESEVVVEQNRQVFEMLTSVAKFAEPYLRELATQYVRGIKEDMPSIQ